MDCQPIGVFIRPYSGRHLTAHCDAKTSFCTAVSDVTATWKIGRDFPSNRNDAVFGESRKFGMSHAMFWSHMRCFSNLLHDKFCHDSDDQ